MKGGEKLKILTFPGRFRFQFIWWVPAREVRPKKSEAEKTSKPDPGGDDVCISYHTCSQLF